MVVRVRWDGFVEGGGWLFDWMCMEGIFDGCCTLYVYGSVVDSVSHW